MGENFPPLPRINDLKGKYAIFSRNMKGEDRIKWTRGEELEERKQMKNQFPPAQEMSFIRQNEIKTCCWRSRATKY